MFSKLLKYEWKANSSLLTILSIAAMVVGAFGGVLLRVMINIDEMGQDGTFKVLGAAGLGIMFFFAMLSLFAYVIAVEFITISHFYKNKFTDEGYLTFTLPVNVRQIFLSSFLNILAWLLISIIVMLISFGLMLLIGAGEHLDKVIPGIIWSLGMAQDEMANYSGYGLYQTLTTMQVVLSPVYSIILIMCCVTMGSVLSKKHKVLVSIALYYGFNMALSTMTSILTAVPQILLLSAMEDYEMKFYLYMNITYGITLALQVAVILVGYFLSTRLMKRKLNLS